MRDWKGGVGGERVQKTGCTRAQVCAMAWEGGGTDSVDLDQVWRIVYTPGRLEVEKVAL